MISLRQVTPDDLIVAKEMALDIYAHNYPYSLDAVDVDMAAVCKENALLALIQLEMLHEGVYVIHAIITKNIFMCRLGFMRYCRRLLDANIKKFNAHRVQINVLSDYTLGKRFAESLGFTAECTMRQYGFNKKDHILYARIT